jgi:Ricin-type beta-trefoil lectin domain-like
MTFTQSTDAAFDSMLFECRCRLSLVEGELALSLFYVDADGTGFGPRIINLTSSTDTKAEVWMKGTLRCLVPPQSLSGQSAQITLLPVDPPAVLLTLSLQGPGGGSPLARGELTGTDPGNPTVSGLGQFGMAAPFCIATSPQNYVIGVQGGSGSAGAAILLSERSYEDDQYWRLDPGPVPGFYYLVSVSSGLVIGASQSSHKAGTPLVLQQRSGNDDQLWSIDHAPLEATRVLFASKADSSLVMDLRYATVENGAVIEQWSRNGQFNQAWLMIGSRI